MIIRGNLNGQRGNSELPSINPQNGTKSSRSIFGFDACHGSKYEEVCTRNRGAISRESTGIKYKEQDRGDA
jgi:hypothetical protein